MFRKTRLRDPAETARSSPGFGAARHEGESKPHEGGGELQASHRDTSMIRLLVEQSTSLPSRSHPPVVPVRSRAEIGSAAGSDAPHDPAFTIDPELLAGGEAAGVVGLLFRRGPGRRRLDRRRRPRRLDRRNLRLHRKRRGATGNHAREKACRRDPERRDRQDRPRPRKTPFHDVFCSPGRVVPVGIDSQEDNHRSRTLFLCDGALCFAHDTSRTLLASAGRRW